MVVPCDSMQLLPFSDRLQIPDRSQIVEEKLGCFHSIVPVSFARAAVDRWQEDHQQQETARYQV